MMLPDGTFIPGLMVLPPAIDRHLTLMREFGVGSDEEYSFWEQHKDDPEFRNCAAINAINLRLLAIMKEDRRVQKTSDPAGPRNA